MRDIIFGLNPVDLGMIITLVIAVVEIEIHQFIRGNASGANKGKDREDCMKWNFLHE